MWELRGCPYCRETHLINFAKPEIENYIKERFEILQLNIIGSREVTDFDGEKLSEKAFAQKYGVRFTPTFQFFPESAAGLAAEDAARARGRARAGLHRAAAVPRHVPLRRGTRLRKGRSAAATARATAQPTFRYAKPLL